VFGIWIHTEMYGVSANITLTISGVNKFGGYKTATTVQRYRRDGTWEVTF